MTIPFESQIDPAVRGCGAACLSMVYKSLGKDVAQEQIWPLIAKPNRFGSVASTTHLMAQHAISQGLSAVIVQARHPLQVLRICRDAGIRAILNHRPQAGASNGHYTVLVDIDDSSVVVHDPSQGASRRLSYAELMQLWQPQSAASEIAGNILIGIAADATPIPACEFCHTVIPAKMDCPRCGKAVGLSPGAVLGCIRDGCIARMWNNVACPSCDFLFNETGKYSPESARPVIAAARKPVLAIPDLDKVFAQLDQFCALALNLPNAAKFPDLKAQVDFIQGNKEKLKLAQAEEVIALNTKIDRMAAAMEASKQKAEERRQQHAQSDAPPAPLDGNALGKALLKNLGFQ